MADDITVIAKEDHEFVVRPAYPALWLWEDSVDVVYRDAHRRPVVPGKGTKARVSSAEGLCYESGSVPLRKIYILQRGNGTSPENGTPRENFLALVANTYATNTLDAATRAKEFAELVAISRQISIERLCAPVVVERFLTEQEQAGY
jgi:hypothetical protein